MFNKIILLTILLILHVSILAQETTWQIGEDLSMNTVSSKQSSFGREFAKITSAVDKGLLDEAKIAIWDFQRNYPDQTADEDWDAYIEAELAFAKGKWKRSSELFMAFLDKYPVSDFYDAALERTYEIGSAFLAGQKRRAFLIFRIRAYDDGEVMMRKIADKSGNSQIAQRALITLAESLEQRQLFLDAYDVWVQVALRTPTGEGGRLSLAGMARTMHSAYNGHNYDASPVRSAEGYYGQYMLRYPEIAKKQGVEELIDTSVEQIAYKQYVVAEFYEKAANYSSAILYYNHIVDSFPDTEVAKMAKEKIEKVSIYSNLKRIKPEDKNLLWRLWHFFDFKPVEKG